MTDLKQQKDLTGGKGWGQVFVESVKGTTKKITTKAQNVWGGVKATPAILKKTFKKD
jgi:hypothetical protein